MLRTLAPWLGIVLWILCTPVLRAAAPDDTESSEVAPDPLVPTSAAEMVLLVAEVEEAQADATAQLSSLAQLEAPARALDQIERFLSAYEEYAARHAEAVFFEDQLVAIRNRVAIHEGQLESLREDAASSLASIKQIHARWSVLRAAWAERSLGKILSGVERAEFAGSIHQVRASIKAALGAAERARASMVELQSRAQAVRARARAVDDQIQAATAAARADWSRRHSPVVWAHGGHEDEALLAVPLGSLLRIEEGFFDRTRDLWILHGLVLGLVVVLASRLRRSVADPAAQSLLNHSIALGVFVTGLTFGPMYQPAPLLLDAALWVVIGVGGFRLATAAFSTVDMRRVGAGLAIAYPLLRVADLLVHSTLALRWTLVISAVAGAAGLALRARQQAQGGSRPWWRLSLVLGALALLVASVTEALGFTALSRPVFGAAIRTGFVIVVFVAGRRVARGGAAGLSGWLSPMVAERWRDATRRWSRHLGWLLEGMLLVGVVLDVLYAWRLLPSPPEAWRAATEATFGIAGLELSLAHMGLAALTLYLARQLSRVIEISLDATLFTRARIESGTGDSIKTLIRYVLIALGGLVALGLLGIEPQSIAIVAGGLGIGIGFGLQSVVADLTSGLILLFEGSIRAGDAVIIDGRWGEVRHIGLRSTVVTMIDQSELVCPNSSLTSEKIENWTLSTRRARVFCPVGIAYGSDVELAFRTLLEVAAADEDTMDEPAPEVLFMHFGDNSLGLELRVWTEKGPQRIQVRSRLLQSIDTAFRTAGIEIAFPQRDLHLKTIDRGVAQALAGRPGAES